MILQNFVPHPQYYGAEVAEIADAAARDRWADEERTTSSDNRFLSWATEITLADMKHLVAGDARTDARRRHPDPAEPGRLVG